MAIPALAGMAARAAVPGLLKTAGRYAAFGWKNTGPWGQVIAQQTLPSALYGVVTGDWGEAAKQMVVGAAGQKIGGAIGAAAGGMGGRAIARGFNSTGIWNNPRSVDARLAAGGVGLGMNVGQTVGLVMPGLIDVKKQMDLAKEEARQQQEQAMLQQQYRQQQDLWMQQMQQTPPSRSSPYDRPPMGDMEALRQQEKYARKAAEAQALAQYYQQF